MRRKYQPHTTAYRRAEVEKPKTYKAKIEDSPLEHIIIKAHFWHRMRERLTHKIETVEKDLKKALESKNIKQANKYGVYKIIGKKATYILSTNYELITMYRRNYDMDKYNNQKWAQITDKQYKDLLR